MRQRIAAAWAVVRRTAATGTFLALTIALACTLFGAGAIVRAVELYDGDVWLWSSPVGQLARTDAHDGRIDLVTDVPESAGNRVEVIQTDDHLILHDLDTGRMTALDLGEMAFSGRLDLGTDRKHSVFLHGEHGVVVDRSAGEVRAIDPTTLTATGEVLKLPAPLEGGAFDADGVLWLGVPSQGTVAAVRFAEGTAKADGAVGVADPADDIALTVREQGPLVVNRSDNTIVEVRDGVTAEIESPVALADAVVPPSTSGPLVAVTVPDADALLTLAGPHDGAEITVIDAGDVGPAAAVPYEGRVYLPGENGVVRVFDAAGGEAEPLEVPGAEGPLDLEVREGHLFVNDPDSGAALVVGPSGEGTEVEKYDDPPGPGGGAADGSDGTGSGTGEAPHGTGQETPPGQEAPDPGQEESPRPQDEEQGAEEPTRPPAPPDLDPGTEPEDGIEPVLPEPTGPASPPWPGADPAAPTTGTVDPVRAPTGGTPAGGEVTPLPGAPVPVTASAGADGVTVTWQPAHSPAAPVTGYIVSWDGGSTTVDGTQHSVVVDGLRDGVPYRFQVRAVNVHGHGNAAASEPVVSGEQPPPPPTDVAVEATGTTTAVLTWTAVPGAHDYVVSGESAHGHVAAVRSTTDTEIELAGLEPGGTYTFTVAARSGGGAQSTAVPAPAVTLPLLDPPENVWFAFSDTGDAYVYWTPVDGAAGYEVVPADDSLDPREIAAGESVEVNGRQYQSIIYGTPGLGCHSFTVRAVDAAGTASRPSEPSTTECTGRRLRSPDGAGHRPTG
ncbi:hypothetical protein FOF52_14515 [Thermobifida alba]|uniref:Fibronectin type-III domain-containing protein n=1 Tax=Thermobifida alba TaxID=53522 RepID=A0ABY4L560_THEAE|nr:fibronectin type III domain-containing protein [Thermobifida alba]UPT22026.1 hypothetical protein FOF52_14515 [Thermobifida alba]